MKNIRVTNLVTIHVHFMHHGIFHQLLLSINSLLHLHSLKMIDEYKRAFRLFSVLSCKTKFGISLKIQMLYFVTVPYFLFKWETCSYYTHSWQKDSSLWIQVCQSFYSFAVGEESLRLKSCFLAQYNSTACWWNISVKIHTYITFGYKRSLRGSGIMTQNLFWWQPLHPPFILPGNKAYLISLCLQYC